MYQRKQILVQVIRTLELSRVLVIKIQVELLKHCTNFYHQVFFFLRKRDSTCFHILPLVPGDCG